MYKRQPIYTITRIKLLRIRYCNAVSSPLRFLRTYCDVHYASILVKERCNARTTVYGALCVVTNITLCSTCASRCVRSIYYLRVALCCQVVRQLSNSSVRPIVMLLASARLITPSEEPRRLSLARPRFIHRPCLITVGRSTMRRQVEFALFDQCHRSSSPSSLILSTTLYLYHSSSPCFSLLLRMRIPKKKRTTLTAHMK